MTGKDIQIFIDQWVNSSGVPKFYGSFVFNRKRNVVELELRQDDMSCGAMKYVVGGAACGRTLHVVRRHEMRGRLRCVL